jgi:hypothetical protein
VNRFKENNWGELTINYNNAISVGTQVGSSGPITAGTWTTVDVTPYILGNGTLNLMLTGASSAEISLASRESGANAPQLIIEPGWQSPPTATFASTATSAPTATSDLSSTPSATPTHTRTATSTPGQTSTPTATTTETGHLFTFVPVADSYVNESSPTTNYGTVTTLRADASPTVRSYLRFDVQGLSGTVTRVTLRIFTNSSSSTGYEVRNVADNTWNEGTLNHTNAPAMDAVTATSGAFGASAWTSVDITPLITGNGSFNIALTTTSSTAFSLASRESGANAPQLVIEMEP